MEETNFYREQRSGIISFGPGPKLPEEPSLATQRVVAGETKYENSNTSSVAPTTVSQRAKSYPQKLKVYDPTSPKYTGRLQSMVFRPLILFSFPVIVYAGFSYGSNLIWFNVLNGTASLILSGKPYGFSSSMVGLSYLSPLLGAVLG